METPSGEASADAKVDAESGGWSAGDHCRAVYAEDGAEYEAAVLSVEADEAGSRYARGAIQ